MTAVSESLDHFTERQYLDGPGLVTWLERVRPELVDPGAAAVLGESASRRIWDWRNGAVAYYTTVDALLVRLGLVLDIDVPDHLWIVGKRRTAGRRVGQQIRRQVEADLIGGLDPTTIAQQHQVSMRTVQRWRAALVAAGDLPGAER